MPGVLPFLTAARKKTALANKMKNMREKLEKISKERQNFNFALTIGASLEQQHYDQRETTSDVNEAKIFGRDGEKKEIIDILSASRWENGTMILPIYGLGGMGKSTLAQLVYNDTQFKQYEHLAWVYVSQEFDLKKIGRSIISQLSVDGSLQNLDTLQMISQCLNKLLPGRKILIVLDDIWEEDASELDKLKHMLHVEKKGSMADVLITTRSESIANKICTSKPHKIQPLDDSVCWDIIKNYSGFKEKSNKVKLEQIGLDIAKKCRGVALAARGLGYMLNTEDLAGWSEMNKNDIWNNESTDVLPSLKLSYERVLPILRLCFSYCAIFPKGHEISEDDLIYQWISLDFIKKPSDGKKYIKQLLGMSFLQHSKLPSVSISGETCYFHIEILCFHILYTIHCLYKSCIYTMYYS
jgi:DNA-binding XRE family transcriptional regulator